MAHNPVGINSALPIASAANRRGVDKTAHQSEYLRVVAKGAGAHVAIGTLPTAAVTNYFVHSGEAEIISLGKPQSNRVTGVSTTGSTVVIDFAEGTGAPFSVGDAVSLTVTGQSYLDFTHKIVSSVNNTAGRDGYHGTRIVVDHDYNVAYAHTDVIGQAELRGSFMVAAYGDGTGTLHYQQIQSAGGPS